MAAPDAERPLRVLIAGGATGIGLAIMRSLRDDGSAVFLADIAAEAAEAAVEEPRLGPAAYVLCDLADENQASMAVQTAFGFLGGLDVLFANAGVLRVAPIEQTTVRDWEEMLHVNLRSPFLLVQAALPYLKRSNNASVIFTSSVAALRGAAGIHGYAASKAGLIGLMRCLAAELGPNGVRVNVICPGLIDTPFNDVFWSSLDDVAGTRNRMVESVPLRREGVPEDIVGIVRFLTSPASAYITGQVLVVDGGYLAT